MTRRSGVDYQLHHLIPTKIDGPKSSRSPPGRPGHEFPKPHIPGVNHSWMDGLFQETGPLNIAVD